jgi:hypothetical protein
VRRLLLLAVLAAAMSFGTAYAREGDPSGSVNPGGQIEVGITVTEPGGTTPTDITSGASGSGSAPVIHYEAIPAPARPGDLSALCFADHGDVLLGGRPVGTWFHVIGRDNAGNIVVDTQVCVPLVDLNSPVPPPPPPLPVAPSIAEIWRSVQISPPELHVDPSARGVTGLATTLWTGGPTTVPVSVRLRGFTVTGVAHLVDYRFLTDEGLAGTTTDPGSSTAPAVRHVFETKGVHRVTVESEWTATITMTGPGMSTPIPVAAGTATLHSSRDYPVVEIRSVLLP